MLDFSAINDAALAAYPGLLERWLPGGAIAGAEYVVRNPTRDDRSPGSFSINIKTGVWADFAAEDVGLSASVYRRKWRRLRATPEEKRA